MKAADAIRLTLGSSQRVLTAYIGDFSDADLLVRPAPGANHTAWQIGHLISSENAMMEALKPGHSPALPTGFAQAHSKDTITVDDPARFLTKQKYLDLFAAQREASLMVLESFSETELDNPGPERFKGFAPTIGALLNGAGTHILMHVGQIATVRRVLNKPIVM